MIRIVVPATEAWDPIKEEFIVTEETKLTLEHSLLSVSKWESKWKVPFVSNKEMTGEMELDYIRCMCTTPVKDDNVFYVIPIDKLKQIKAYIEDPMSASTFEEKKKSGARKTLTSEHIYCYMAMYRIPFETEKWHFNRLLNLIRYCGIENSPPEKMSRNELLMRNAKLNAERRARLHTKG